MAVNYESTLEPRIYNYIYTASSDPKHTWTHLNPKNTSLTTLLLQMFMVWICLDGVWINILASSTGFVNKEGFVFAAMLLLWDLGLAVYKFGTMIYNL